MARTVSIRTTIIGGETLERNIKLRYNSIVRNQMESVGKQMVANANALMAGDFDLNRPNERRRYPGSRRASTALDYAIGGNEDRLTLGFRVLGGNEVLKRIRGMNYGLGGGHRINASGNWPLKGATLAVRDNPGRAGTGSTGQFLAWPENGGWRIVRGGVNWRPTGIASQGTGFIEEALAAASDTLKARLAS